MEAKRKQHDYPAAFVVAQNYSSVIFVSLPFQSRKEKFGKRLKKLLFQSLTSLKTALILKQCDSGTAFVGKDGDLRQRTHPLSRQTRGPNTDRQYFSTCWLSYGYELQVEVQTKTN
jgi:hypothetical protein